MILVAGVQGLTVVTAEQVSGSLQKPRIPDVAPASG